MNKKIFKHGAVLARLYLYIAALSLSGFTALDSGTVDILVISGPTSFSLFYVPSLLARSQRSHSIYRESSLVYI